MSRCARCEIESEVFDVHGFDLCEPCVVAWAVAAPPPIRVRLRQFLTREMLSANDEANERLYRGWTRQWIEQEGA